MVSLFGRNSSLTLALSGFTGLVACSGAPAAGADASADNVEVALATDAPADAPHEASSDAADDAQGDGDGDGGSACADFSGAWRWTGSCDNPAIQLQPDCFGQTGCSVTGLRPGRVIDVRGNVSTVRLTREADGLDGTQVIAVTGDTARLELTFTAPLTARCTATGLRVRFPGASGYCCDVGHSACAEGQRCNLFRVGASGTIYSACVAAGTIARGAMCAREMETLGADTCAPGNFCANFDQATMATRTCQQLCRENSDCSAGSICGRITDTPRSGVCRRRCAPMGGDCLGGSSCKTYLTFPDRGQGYLVDAVCAFDGTSEEGAPCSEVFQCGANMTCHFAPGGGRCRRVCDATHACAEGTMCEPDYVGATTFANPTGLGGCVPPT